MISLTIDNQRVEVPEGMTVLQAAQQLGFKIPTMCHKEGFRPSTSCMVCVVEIEGYKALMPSCSMPVEEGMVVRTGTERAATARRAALELLLSDHIGDCEGPCRLGCPANMDIPLMIRQIIAGDFRQAIQTVKRDIALPAVLGRICPAPCEKVCRRAGQDAAVSICLLKRFVADEDLKSSSPFKLECASFSRKRIAVVGAGPCGLSAAYYLAQKGHHCVVFDKNDHPGGMLRCEELKEKLPTDVLDREISLIVDLGAEFQPHKQLGRDFSLDDLRCDYDAVFLAIGQAQHCPPVDLPIEMTEEKIKISHKTYQTSMDGVFAGGGVVGSRRLCVKAVADGKEAAEAMDQFLLGRPITGIPKEFNSRLGALSDQEWKDFASAAEPHSRIEPEDPKTGFSVEQAAKEARRCLHCDCRKKKNCRLRHLSGELKALSTTYKGLRRTYARMDGHPEVIFEPGKCIQCGLCIQVLKRTGHGRGLTFRGRGFSMQLAAALDQSIEETVGPAGRQCVEVCPTGAWALKNEQEL